MESISSVAAGLGAAYTGGEIANSVLKSVQNLEADQVARLFASFGLGQNVNTYA